MAKPKFTPAQAAENAICAAIEALDSASIRGPDHNSIFVLSEVERLQSLHRKLGTAIVSAHRRHRES